MFKKKKQLVKVVVTLTHMRSLKEVDPDIVETIYLLRDQTFEREIEGDVIYEKGLVVKAFDWIAGSTKKYEYFYEDKKVKQK